MQLGPIWQAFVIAVIVALVIFYGMAILFSAIYGSPVLILLLLTALAFLLSLSLLLLLPGLGMWGIGALAFCALVFLIGVTIMILMRINPQTSSSEESE